MADGDELENLNLIGKRESKENYDFEAGKKNELKFEEFNQEWRGNEKKRENIEIFSQEEKSVEIESWELIRSRLGRLEAGLGRVGNWIKVRNSGLGRVKQGTMGQCKPIFNPNPSLDVYILKIEWSRSIRLIDGPSLLCTNTTWITSQSYHAPCARY